ncbi:MAG: hypothetical protein DMG34_14755 [Acidobacteria bacterium]|nr:MAG: hypothetical protein DMG34_14755 [Acidobacteriota bacterium]
MTVSGLLRGLSWFQIPSRCVFLKGRPAAVQTHQLVFRLPVQGQRILDVRKRREPAGFLLRRKRRCNIAPRFRLCIDSVDAHILQFRSRPSIEPLVWARLAEFACVFQFRKFLR